MLTTLKLGCLAVYALGFAALAGGWHSAAATFFEGLSVTFIVIHLLELPFFWKALHTYRGSFASSVLQSLLFGVFHSLPLKRAAQA
jgi:uncharacterized protein YhhL (DUF1145 family)